MTDGSENLSLRRRVISVRKQSFQDALQAITKARVYISCQKFRSGPRKRLCTYSVQLSFSVNSGLSLLGQAVVVAFERGLAALWFLYNRACSLGPKSAAWKTHACNRPICAP